MTDKQITDPVLLRHLLKLSNENVARLADELAARAGEQEPVAMYQARFIDQDSCLTKGWFQIAPEAFERNMAELEYRRLYTASDAALREALCAARDELRLHDAEYKHRTKTDLLAKIDVVLFRDPGEAAPSIREALERSERLHRYHNNLPEADLCGKALAALPQDEPEYIHDDPLFNKGVQYVVELIARELSVTDWVAGDGSEDYDTDLWQTILNILSAKGLYSKETGELADEAAIRADEREKCLSGVCENLILTADCWKHGDKYQPTGIALLGAATLIGGKERVAAIRKRNDK